MRHTRQVRLREIGEAGQARLAAAEVHVAGDGLAGEVEARYLAGAGVSLTVEAEAVATAAREVDPSVRVAVRRSGAPRPWGQTSPLALRDPAAREVARGAHAALAAIRAILAGGSA